MPSGVPKDVAIFGPIRSKVRTAHPQAVTHGTNHGDQEKNHDQRANGSRDADPLQELDGGIEEVREQDGEQQSDDDTGGVIEKQKDDRARQNAQAGGRTGNTQSRWRRFRSGQATPLLPEHGSTLEALAGHRDEIVTRG